MKHIDDLLLKYENEYNKSFISIPFNRYVKIGIIGTLFISLTSLILSYSFLSRIFIINNLSQIQNASIYSIIFFIISITIFFLYPNYMESKVKTQIEDGLLYTVSNMIVLANCGFSVDRILSQATEIEQNSSLKKMMTSFIADIKIKGYDIEQALQRLIDRNPSKNFAEVLSGVSNASWTSGDLKEVLMYHFQGLERTKKDETENMINSLTVLSEIYVAMMVIAPIMLIIMFTLLSVLNNVNQYGTVSILNSITFIFLPFVGTGFLVLLDTMRGSD